MTVLEVSKIISSNIIKIKSSKNGRILCHNYRWSIHTKFSDRVVRMLEADQSIDGTTARAIIVIWIGEEE